jgi:hypothetical protein
MDGQSVIDLSVPVGGDAGLGTLVLDPDHQDVDAEVATTAAVAPPLELAPGALRLWAWRVLVAIAVVVVLAGLVAFASTPPA